MVEISALDATSTIQMLLRWIHLLAGITWIGILYFFNLVNVDFLKSLDAPTKGKVIPQLMPRALWWFRWGAVVTVLAGLIYYIWYLHIDWKNRPEVHWGQIFLTWLIIVAVAYVFVYMAIRAINNGWALAIAVGVIVVVMSALMLKLNSYPGASNKSVSIGIGGGMGVIMLLNVWGIIWPNQKRIIAWTAENAAKGTAIPAESAALARKAFLASRTNFWLSLPMLFFMGASSHYPLFGTV